MELATALWAASSGWLTDLPAWDSEATLVLAFGDRCLERDPTPLQELADWFPRSTLIGCSTSGQVAGSSVRDDVLTVAVARFASSRLVKVSADVQGGVDSLTAGQILGRGLAADDLRYVLVLSDGLCVNGSDLVAGLLSSVGSEVVVTGGLAGDGDRFERTWVIDDGVIHAGRVVAVGVYGESLRIGSGSMGGWGIFGPERFVTRSDGNVLYELDGKPALELYKQYLGDLAAGLPATALLFPLAVRPDAQGDQLVRTVLAVGESDQSMTFAGDIPQGWRAQLMRSSPDRLIDGAAGAAAQSRVGHSGVGPTLGIAISCVGRRLVLGQRTEEELEAALEVLPAGSEMVGFYSYGEIAPGAGGRGDLHNQTMTITTLSEG